MADLTITFIFITTCIGVLITLYFFLCNPFQTVKLDKSYDAIMSELEAQKKHKKKAQKSRPCSIKREKRQVEANCDETSCTCSYPRGGRGTQKKERRGEKAKGRRR